MLEIGDTQPGLRERKRRQTRQRIIDSGLKLFLANGFEATTLDALAAAAEISRRTFFSYFTSKEEVVMAWQDGAEEALHAAVVAEAPGKSPLEAARAALIRLVPLFETHNFVELDRLMRSTETLRARKQGHYERQERSLYATLAAIWPEPERQARLRAVAMVAIGCLRLATERWLAEAGARSIVSYLDEACAAVKAEI